MNYATHYDHLISRARGRILEGYRECHHVLPKCMGGGNERGNIVELTAEEHYLAHQLLVRIHRNNMSLVHAAVWMARRCSGNKAYGWLRRKHAEVMADRMFGKRKTASTIAKLSAAKKGKAHPRNPEWQSKIDAANRGRKHSDESRAKMSVAQRGNKHNLGRKFTQEHKANLSASLMGHRGCRGIPKMPEHRAKIAAALTGKPLSEERKAKISASRRAYFQSITAS